MLVLHWTVPAPNGGSGAVLLSEAQLSPENHPIIGGLCGRARHAFTVW